MTQDADDAIWEGAELDRIEREALAKGAVVTRDTRTETYFTGSPGSRKRLLIAHETTGFYATGLPRPAK